MADISLADMFNQSVLPMRRACLPANRASVPPLLVAWLCVIATAPAAEAQPSAAVRDALLRSTVRIRYERQEGGATITGHGTAFGVDLSHYGYPGRRFLLTAAHNVLDDCDRKLPYGALKVEIEEGSRTYWSRCRAVVWDETLDLCLVEAGDDVPAMLRLAESDPRLGSQLIMAGSPRGVPVTLFAGTLDQKFERGTVRSSATVPFDHGDSGGPMVDAASGRVVGVAVAGVPKDGDLDHSIGLFVPVVGITSFLEANRRGAPAPPPVRTEPVAAEPRSRAPQPPVASVPPSSRQDGAEPAAEFREPVAVTVAAVESRRPEPEHASAVKASASAGATPPASPAMAPEPRALVEQKPLLAQASPRVVGPLAVAATEAPRTGSVYVVQKGDNLTKIARQCNVRIGDLAKANSLKDPNCLLVGMRLAIPAQE